LVKIGQELWVLYTNTHGTFISRCFLLKMRNVSDSVFREIKNRHFTFSDVFRKSRLLRENMEKLRRDGQVAYDNTIRRVRILYWIPKATDTHSQCVILIAFPLQQWLRERSSMLCYTCIACLVCLREITVQLHTFIQICCLGAQICVQSLPLRVWCGLIVVKLSTGKNCSVTDMMEEMYNITLHVNFDLLILRFYKFLSITVSLNMANIRRNK
jgi:hypothetical protein